MNRLVFLILVCIIAFTSCDGRDRAYQSNKTVLENHNLFKSFSEKVEFTPEQCIEIDTDTLLSNQFNIKIKYFSLDKDQILKRSQTKDQSKINHYYRNFEALVKITKEDHLIGHLKINKKLFSEYETKTFWEQAIMQFVWVDYEKTTDKTINLNVSFCIPTKNTCKDYTIIVNENGNIKIEHYNLAKAII